MFEDRKGVTHPLASHGFHEAMRQAKRIPSIKSRQHKRQAIRNLLATLRSAVGGA